MNSEPFHHKQTSRNTFSTSIPKSKILGPQYEHHWAIKRFRRHPTQRSFKGQNQKKVRRREQSSGQLNTRPSANIHHWALKHSKGIQFKVTQGNKRRREKVRSGATNIKASHFKLREAYSKTYEFPKATYSRREKIKK